MQESPGLNPDWFWDIKPFSMKTENNLSKILPHIGRGETGL